jgi:outer membrane PBP1 activator LpoA protein
MLETGSSAFARATQSVLAGLRAAVGVDGQGFQLLMQPVSETGEDLPAQLDALVARGAVMAIGPLTRGGVNALCGNGSLPVQVLALNQPDLDRAPPPGMVIFSLVVEAEARQVARAAYREAATHPLGHRPLRALVLSNGSALSRRTETAFGEAWREAGGMQLDTLELVAGPASEWRASFEQIPPGSGPDVVIAALTFDGLRTVRPVLPAETPIWGTSHLNAVQSTGGGRLGSELDGVRFVEMPWVLMPDHVAVIAYPRAPALTHLDYQRLYAHGIDAWRVARELLQRSQRFEIDGVSGWLRADLATDLRIERTMMLAEFRNGRPVPVMG